MCDASSMKLEEPHVQTLRQATYIDNTLGLVRPIVLSGLSTGAKADMMNDPGIESQR